MQIRRGVEKAGSKVVSKETYQIVEENGRVSLQTKCPREKCSRPYSIDYLHPRYDEVKLALDRGDRSKLFCYHRIVSS